MTIKVLTLFPEMFGPVMETSILGRARANGLITIEATDIRPFSKSKHKNTDDYPFGGGAGMLMMAQPIADAIKFVCEKRGVPCRSNLTAEIQTEVSTKNEEESGLFLKDNELKNEKTLERSCKRIYLSPRGVPLTQKLAQE